jgi:hypothetical protein
MFQENVLQSDERHHFDRFVPSGIRVLHFSNTCHAPSSDCVRFNIPLRLKSPVSFSLYSLLNEEPGNIRPKAIAVYGFLLAGNLGAWLWAVVTFRHFPVFLGTSFLAYSFGLRPAVDADHIAAIDNVTRKLRQEGKRPVAVGLMFSLGHSTVFRFSLRGLPTRLGLLHKISKN